MMRITNGMMMNTTKLNINNNKVNVDKLNTQMSTQKKIVKPSDNPLIAIKSLRLSTTLSKINQYYGSNIKDAQSWMDVTETALTNMKDVMTDAYRLCVQGATDTLNDDDRNTILTQLKGLSSQIYNEANADYADRTIFTGYKTNSTVAFTDAQEASQAKYQITEQLSASDIETYAYYANGMDTPTSAEIPTSATGAVDYLATPQEEELKRLRLSYNAQTQMDSFSYSYAVDTSSSATDGSTHGTLTIASTQAEKVDNTTNPPTTTTVTEQTVEWRTLRKDSAFTYQADSTGTMTGATLVDLNGYTLNIDTNGDVSTTNTELQEKVRSTTLSTGEQKTIKTYLDTNGNTVFTAEIVSQSVTDPTTGNSSMKVVSGSVVDSQGNVVRMSYDADEKMTEITDTQGNTLNTNLENPSTDAANIIINNADGNVAATLAAVAGENRFTVKTSDGLETNLKIKKMTEKEFQEYLSALAADNDGSVAKEYEDTLIYLPDSGELVLGSNLATNLTSEAATLNVDYYKEGFSVGETRPEMYFNCTNKTDASRNNWITYTNYDEDHNWIAQNINYTVANNQELAINTQIHDVVDADCYRDLAEMTDIVQDAIDAHTTVSNIENMLKSTEYADEESQNYLKDCLEKANKQMAYMDDHLQKVFSAQITNFENYQNKVNLAITNNGTKGDQLSLTENRMSSQQTTFKELKSNNEDEELSDVTIDYTAAYTAFQASLQAAGKIDDMSLLDYL